MLSVLKNYLGLVGTRRNYSAQHWNGATVAGNSSTTKPIDLEGGEAIRASITVSGSNDWDVDIHYYETEDHNTLISTHNVTSAQGSDTEINVDELMAYPYATLEISNNDSTEGTLNAVVQVT